MTRPGYYPAGQLNSWLRRLAYEHGLRGWIGLISPL